jgi:hypothetical protein
MGFVRAFFRDHRRFAALLVALALAMKALVPGGYMIGQQGKVLTVTICADASGTGLTRQIVVPTSESESQSDRGKSGEHGKSDSPCPYAALGMAALGGADTVLLALALAFILALGFAPLRPVRPERRAYLRPPLRGPPAQA